jgi:hypothetical protein
MTLIAHAADGLVMTGYLNLNAIDSERHIMLLVGVWVVAAAVVVLLNGRTLIQRSTVPQPVN